MKTSTRYRTLSFLSLFLFALVPASPVSGQSFPAAELKRLVQVFKDDARGPYQGIRWFCPDGSILPANTRCPQPGGMQHALAKDVVPEIAKRNGIYLGQILAGTPVTDFLDLDNAGSRAKQYQMEKFLQAVDDGWIVRKARFYRGAVQAEDEESWGMRFLAWMLAQDDLLASRFFLCRQLVQDIPHRAGDQTVVTVRALARTVADSLPAFMDMRIKIHGQPDGDDAARVAAFRQRHAGEITPGVGRMLEKLERDLAAVYGEVDAQKLSRYAGAVAKMPPLSNRLKALLAHRLPSDAGAFCRDAADLLWRIRIDIVSADPAARLAMMDLSVDLEALLFRAAGAWTPTTIGDLLDKGSALARAAAGCGYVEVWEWQRLASALSPAAQDAVLPLQDFLSRVAHLRRTAEWGSGMVRAVYDPTVTLFAGFEPLAVGFVDDRIRGGILLRLGEVTGKLTGLGARSSGISNAVMGVRDPGEVRGLNPGFSAGELEVVTGPPEDVAFLGDRIYFLLRAPADLKPVAGIATVTEGNTVSHVQLLARNLGIPNAVISSEALSDLAPFSHTRIFYAVSPRGAVVVKPESTMTAEEKALVETRKRSEERIAVPTDRLDLSHTGLPHLIDLRAADSGRLCGPKAANLGQLRAMFPERVAPGVVVPFGVFRQHMDQPMPRQNQSFWTFLRETFAAAALAREEGMTEEAVEQEVLRRLTVLRDAIKQIALLPAFVDSLEAAFPVVFGAKIAEVPVFVRSDTNMEDLKDFTGAGLNLTVPNVVKREDILQAIRDVWASPFTERSYRWRQKYLLNPENVYPSILLLRSVNVEKSGVMITTGIASSDPKDVTVAFNRGVGGAVEGQAAESYLLRHDGTGVLLSPARDARFTYLPAEGGVRKGSATFEHPILTREDRVALRRLAEEIRRRLPGTPGIASEGPFDVELGFLKGEIWLFQVRPFVENKRARSSAYLCGLDTELPADVEVPLDGAIE